MKNPQLAPAQVSAGANHPDETESTFRMNPLHTVRTSQWIGGTNIRRAFALDMLQELMEIRNKLNWVTTHRYANLKPKYASNGAT